MLRILRLIGLFADNGRALVLESQFTEPPKVTR